MGSPPHSPEIESLNTTAHKAQRLPMSDEPSFTDEALRLAEEEARRLDREKHKNPFSEESLHTDPAVQKILRGDEDPDRQKMLDSYHRLKSHRQSLRTGLLIESI